MVLDKTLLVLLTAVLSAALVFIALIPPSEGGQTPTVVTNFNVTATGSGRVSLDPDQVTVVLGIETMAPTARESQEQNSITSSRVITSLKGLGIPENMIKTTGYYLGQEYDWTKNGTRVFKGYKAVHTITVTSYNTSLAGRIVDSAASAGANSVSSISFGLKPETLEKAKREAIGLAAGDAMERTRSAAEAMAPGESGLQACGLKPVSLATEYYYYPVTRYAGMLGPAPEAGNTGTQMQPGQVTVTASVRGVFSAALCAVTAVYS